MLKNKKLICVSGTTKSEFFCDSCQLGKLSKLPFSSTCSSLGIFEKVHCNLWSSASVLSIGIFKFYACFVDDFSKFTWIVPLKRKLDFF